MPRRAAPRRAAALACCCLAGGALPAAGEAEGAWAEVLSHGAQRGFPTYEQANQLLHGWLQKYPESLKEKRIGASYERRPINAYVLGKSFGGASHHPPQVLITSLMHAREPASLTVLLYFLGRLLELYSQGDAQAVYVLETREIWLVPFVNPDSYIANQGLKRKVLRKNRRPTCPSSTDSGVDINRNFGFHWSKEFALCNEEYQGTEPFSEPETQALKKICEENKFEAAVNFHAFGSMLTHPYNWARRPQLPKDDQQVYDEIAKVFGWKKFGPAIKTVGYTAPGESDDWMYGARKIISMSPEVGPESGEFWPPAHLIPGINQRNFRRTMYVVRKAGLELSVEWAHRPLRSNLLPANATLLAGGLPEREMELRLGNSGLAASAGQALRLAVSGLVGPGSEGKEGPMALILPEVGGSLPVQVQPALPGGGGRALTFQLPPLPRRSRSRLRLLTGKASELSGPRSLRLCAAEVHAAGAARAVCHCSGAVELAAGSGEEAVAKPPKPPALLLLPLDSRPAAGEDEALCRAAAASGTLPSVPAALGPAGAGTLPSVPAALGPAGAGKAPAPKPSAHSGPVSQAISAASVPTPAIAAAVLNPAFEASGGGDAAAAMAIAAFAAAACALGTCLAFQVLLGRRLRPASAYRRPQAPPPLPPAEGERRLKVGSYDDDTV